MNRLILYLKYSVSKFGPDSSAWICVDSIKDPNSYPLWHTSSQTLEECTIELNGLEERLKACGTDVSVVIIHEGWK